MFEMWTEVIFDQWVKLLHKIFAVRMLQHLLIINKFKKKKKFLGKICFYLHAQSSLLFSKSKIPIFLFSYALQFVIQTLFSAPRFG